MDEKQWFEIISVQDWSKTQELSGMTRVQEWMKDATMTPDYITETTLVMRRKERL
jgi:hypothetical protein